jgi:hypothetical protein
MFDRFKNRHKIFLLLPLIILLSASAAFAQGTAFSYQGKLADGGAPANGTFDMQFKLFDTADPGTGIQQGSTITLNNPLVQVTNGIFSVQLDFGAVAFPGADRFLEIGVRRNNTDPYTVMTPRSKITSSTYAIRSLNATSADGLSSACIGCVQDAQISALSASKITGTLPPSTISASSLPAGSGNYIQNTTSPQTVSNFNISGNGTAAGTLSGNIVTATTQYNIGSDRVLSSNVVSSNIFAGVGAGTNNTSGRANSFFGMQAGLLNAAGNNNSFFGSGAGLNNTASDNSFFGMVAGINNQTGASNSFFGSRAGSLNQTGGNNSFFGASAGKSNAASNNSFFGTQAGLSNTTGTLNSFFGVNAGSSNITASGNSFFGASAGQANTTGVANSFFGIKAGQLNISGQNNSFFGSNAGSASTSSDNSFFGANAGQLNNSGFANSFFGSQAGSVNSTGQLNSFFGYNAGGSNAFGTSNAFFGVNAGRFNTIGSNNAFFGGGAGNNNILGSNNTYIGSSADGLSTPFPTSVSNSTAVGANAFVSRSDSLVLGSINGVNGASASINVGIGTSAPLFPLHVKASSPVRIIGETSTLSGSEYVDFFARNTPFNSDMGGMRIQREISTGNIDTLLFAAPAGGPAVEMVRVSGNGNVGIGNPGFFTEPRDRLEVNGIIRANVLGTAGSTTLCRNASNQIATCSSSLRYKKDLLPFFGGLDLLKRLRPISFTWKDGNLRDLGLAAEDVAKVEPLLVTHNDKGEVEGVKYDRVSVVLINAVTQQQAQIEEQKIQLEQQRSMISRQQTEIDALKKLVCQNQSKAKVCAK